MQKGGLLGIFSVLCKKICREIEVFGEEHDDRGLTHVMLLKEQSKPLDTSIGATYNRLTLYVKYGLIKASSRNRDVGNPNAWELLLEAYWVKYSSTPGHSGEVYNVI